MKQKKSVEIVDFNNFYNGNKVKTEVFYNYNNTHGLKESKGIREVGFPTANNKIRFLDFESAGVEAIDGINYFAQYYPDHDVTTYRLLMHATNKNMYYSNAYNGGVDVFRLYELTFDEAPIGLKYKQDGEERILLADRNKMVVWRTEYMPMEITDVPVVTSMCYNEGNVFCTLVEPENRVMYTHELRPEALGVPNDDIKYIDVDHRLGSCRKVVTLNGYVYVIQDYGISQISFMATQDYTCTIVYESNSKIYPNTVAVCVNKLIFMTKTGLYSFDGIDAKRIKFSLDEGLDMDNSQSTAGTMGNKYYLALKLNFNDDEQVMCEQGDYVNNALIIYNLDEYTFEIVRGFDIKQILGVRCPYYEKVLLVFNSQYTNKIGEIVDKSVCFDENLIAKWSSDYLNENIKPKQATKLMVKASAGVTFKLTCDSKVHTLTTVNDGYSEIRFKTECKTMKLEISSQLENVEIEKVLVEYYEY